MEMMTTIIKGMFKTRNNSKKIKEMKQTTKNNRVPMQIAGRP